LGCRNALSVDLVGLVWKLIIYYNTSTRDTPAHESHENGHATPLDNKGIVVEALSITTLSITTLSITTLSITTLSITTLSTSILSTTTVKGSTWQYYSRGTCLSRS
jgi:hypothetical protein